MKLEHKRIPSSKGSLSAAFHYPDQSSGWLAVLCPGFLDSKDYQGLVGLANVLCEKGFTVVRFDPTGTWGSDGDIVDYTTTQYLEDVRCVVDYALTEKPYKKVLVGGHSRGGRIAVFYAARDPRISLVLGIMLSSGSLGGEVRQKWESSCIRIERRDIPGKLEESVEFRVPIDHLMDLDRYDVLLDVQKVIVPTIFVAGEQDEINPPEDVREVFDHANEPKKFIIVPGVGHDYRHNLEHVRLVNEKIAELLDEYI